MVETVRERLRKRLEEGDHDTEESETGRFGRETEIVFAGTPREEEADDVETILTTTPDELGLSAEQRRAAERSEFEEGVREELLGGSSVGSEELAELIGREVGDADLQQTQVELLQTITSLLNSILSSNVSQLSTMNSVLNSVEPALSITASGNNVVEDADVPEPLVPNSDSTTVPTKTLYVRAAASNTAPIAIGDDSTDPDTAFFLERGEDMTLNIDLRDQTLYMASSEAGNVVKILGMV